MEKDRQALFTFYARVYDKEVAEYFCDVLLASNQPQNKTLEAMVLFARDHGFKMPMKEVDRIDLFSQMKARKISKIMSRKKSVSKK